MFKQTPVTANKICHQDSLKVVVLNHSSKGAVAGSIRTAHFS